MKDRLFVMGAHGRVGRLLRAILPGAVTWQARKGADIDWSLDAGADALARSVTGHAAILCLAGATPGPARDASDFSLNTELALAAIQAAAKAGVPRVLLASSMAVYGGGDAPQPENAPCAPAAPYGASKLEMERAALALAARHGIAVTALRLGNVVGADMLFRNIAAGQRIVIDRFADGATPRRSYVDPASLADMLQALLALPALPPVLNVAVEPPAQMGALADAAGADWTPRPAPDGALPLAAMDLSRLSALIAVPRRDAAALVAGLHSAEAPR